MMLKKFGKYVLLFSWLASQLNTVLVFTFPKQVYILCREVLMDSSDHFGAPSQPLKYKAI